MKLRFLLLSFLLVLVSSSFAQKTNVVVLEVRGGIDPIMNRYVELGLEFAKDTNADIVIIDMDTYGGGVLDADEISQRFLAFEKPIYVYINTNAGSAGSLLSISCDSIYMAPASSFGASTVVDQQGQVVPEKYQSFMRTKMRAAAQATGRDPEIAAAMVGLHLQTDSAKVVAFTTDEAIEKGFCEGQVTSIDSLLKRVGVTDYSKTTFETSQTEKIIAIFLNPALKSILILVIVGGIFYELKTPGVGFPILAATTALILYFLPDYLHGLLANWEFFIFIIGVVLIVLEVAVIPGFGVAGISGLVFVFAALILSMVKNDVFDFTFVSASAWENVYIVMMVSFIGLAFLTFVGVPLIFKTKGFQKIALMTTLNENAQGNKKREIIGKEGVVYSVLRPSGRVQLDDDIYDAYTESAYLEIGTPVVVVADNGVSIKVKVKK